MSTKSVMEPFLSFDETSFKTIGKPHESPTRALFMQLLE